MSEPKALDPVHQERTNSPHGVKEAISCICVCWAGAIPPPVIERRFAHVKQVGYVVFSQEAHFLRDSFLHYTVSKAPAVMTVSASSLTKKPGVVPAACQYMEYVSMIRVKAQRTLFFTVP
ncbi:hypothetical protein HBO18_06720 [Pseudomonas lactis]|uniref:Uncharacterized protein n=1 Tax=Pseudomonas lactis TaxID=1615674 RepID=A0A7Y1PXM3_9PSED|nr:hypothetical protein [Pseudomonas lactis]NNA43822.1 hypothetical protein [Pseudomonas lactis]